MIFTDQTKCADCDAPAVRVSGTDGADRTPRPRCERHALPATIAHYVPSPAVIGALFAASHMRSLSRDAWALLDEMTLADLTAQGIAGFTSRDVTAWIVEYVDEMIASRD